MKETLRPSERYTREDYYRNDNPDHHATELEENHWSFAGKFEDHNDPTYGYATRERDLLREQQIHPDKSDVQQRHYDQVHSRSQYGNEDKEKGS